MKWYETALLFGILIIDQLTKWIAETTLVLHEPKWIIPDFFALTYAQNTGGAWSILSGKMIFLYIVTIVALSGMIYFFQKSKSDDIWTRICLILLIAGALGNFIDRIAFQYVRDFLDFYILGYDFPIFNVADMSLSLGVAILFGLTLFEKKEGHENGK